MVFTYIVDACQYVHPSGGGSFPAIIYADIASASAPGTTPPLKEFINAGYTIGEATGVGIEDKVLKYFKNTGPAVINSNKTICQYFGYPLGSPDYRNVALSENDIHNKVMDLIRDGNLISKEQLYNSADFISPPNANQASLIFLYQTLSQSNNTLSNEQKSQMDKLEAINLNTFGLILAEYCYYKRLYLYLLNKYFAVYNYTNYSANGPDIGIDKIGGIEATAKNGPMSIVPSSTINVQAYNLNQIAYYLACINSRIVDINSLLQSINLYYSSTLASISQELEASGYSFGSQADVEARVNTLQSSAKNIHKLQSEADFRKGVIEYTEEKNRYSTLLLGFYAFLNIAALGIIMNLRE
jgi:hypothetical protein